MQLLVFYNLYYFISLALSKIGLTASDSILENLIFFNSMFFACPLLLFGNGIITVVLLVYENKKKACIIDCIMTLLGCVLVYICTKNDMLIQFTLAHKCVAYVLYVAIHFIREKVKIKSKMKVEGEI